MKEKIIGGILAGGTGTRMKTAKIPKQFLKIGGIPIIIRTLDVFCSVDEIEEIVITMNEAWIDYAEDLLKEYDYDNRNIHIIQGGNSRFDSLICMAKYSLQNFGDNSILINHDCARPFVSSRIIKDNLKLIDKYDMTTTSIPTVDTIIVSEDGKQSSSVPVRSTIYQDQGPQAFRVKEFLNIVNTLDDRDKNLLIEAGKMYLENGLSVGIVLGERENFKITSEIDMILAENYLRTTRENI